MSEANSEPAVKGDHVREAGPFRDRDRGIRDARVFITDVFHEQQHENIVLVLAGIHAATQLVATGPEGGVEFRFLEGQRSVGACNWLPHVGPVDFAMEFRNH